MAEPFLAEIRIVSFNFAPRGWAQCDGQLLPINQNQALFSLLGTTFGGNGITTFGLPDYRARVPIHDGGGHILGERGGESAHTLSIAEVPTHQHALNGTSTAADTNVPSAQSYLGVVNNTYSAPANLVGLASTEIASVGGSQPHLNDQPFLTLVLCIALQGIFPSQS